jgi:hypothetical protein
MIYKNVLGFALKRVNYHVSVTCCRRPQYLPETGRCQFKTPLQTFRARSKCQQINPGIALVSGRSDVIVWQARFQYSGFLIVTKSVHADHYNIPLFLLCQECIPISVFIPREEYMCQYSSTACGSEMQYTSSNLHISHYTLFHTQIFTNLKIFTVYTKPH